MRHFSQALRTKDRAIIMKYLQLQGERMLYYFLYGVLTIVIGIPLVLLLFAIAVVIMIVLFVVAIVFFLVAMVALLFGKDIVGWMQERMKQEPSNENDES